MKFFSRDFVLISGANKFKALNELYQYVYCNDIKLFYEPSSLSINSWLINKTDSCGLILKQENPFMPVYFYSKKDVNIISPNYEHLFNLTPQLSINNKGIIEFVLFHTPQMNNTFHEDVKRMIGVKMILIEENKKIRFEYYKEKETKLSLKETFSNKASRFFIPLTDKSNAIFLSGGGESRINAAGAQAYNIKKDFVTWGHPENIEYKIAGKIAGKLNTKHISIRPEISTLPYKELLERTGFLANLQYAYRYAVFKSLFNEYGYDAVWTGWGDINGYPMMHQPSELFSEYYLGLYEGKEVFPKGWNREWLRDTHNKPDSVITRIRESPNLQTFFDLKREWLAPVIFGQILSLENLVGPVISPWFHPDIYSAVEQAEKRNPKLIHHKIWRTIWKNDLYFKLIKQYCPGLNYIKNSKGYYPWMVQKKTGLLGLLVAGFLKKWFSEETYPIDPVENKTFMVNELKRIESESHEIFSREEIQQIIKTEGKWKGPDIFEYFKIIQVDWFLKK
ncbi:MAG: hypothetical protein ACP5DQ_07825 [Bacteroidales bacterium]